MLIDLEMNKKMLSERAGISASTLTKLSKGECVHMEMLVRICNALECNLCDIVELVPTTEFDDGKNNETHLIAEE